MINELSKHIPINDINYIIMEYTSNLSITDTAVKKFRTKIYSLMKRLLIEPVPKSLHKRIKIKCYITNDIVSAGMFVDVFIDGVKDDMLTTHLFYIAGDGQIYNFNGLNTSIYDKNIRPISKHVKGLDIIISLQRCIAVALN